jgi:hypothetical protein
MQASCPRILASDSSGDCDLHSGGPEGDAQSLGGGVQLDRHAVIVSHLRDTGAAAKGEASPYSGEDAVNGHSTDRAKKEKPSCFLWSLQTSYSPSRVVIVYADTPQADAANGERIAFPLENQGSPAPAVANTGSNPAA